MSNNPQKKSWLDDLPFPKHWLGYIAIKILVLGLVLFVTLKYMELI